MVAYPNLISAMAVREISQSALANSIGVSMKTFRKKLNGDTEFKFGEAEKIQASYFPDIPILRLFARAEPPDEKESA